MCRDAIGERTLYWIELSDGIAFASTLRGLLASGLVERHIDPVSVASYLCFGYLPGARSMLRGVRELLPGELIRWDGSVVHSSRIWSLAPEPEHSQAADEEHQAARLRDCLETAVRRRLPDAHEPAGATLSGGIDSSLVVAIARNLHAAPVHTYAISFGPEYRNELTFSSLVAAHCGSVHHILELPQDAVLQHLDETIALLSDPIGDPLTVPNALAFREAARDVGVVLNGEGGDPCFGGPKNLPMLLAELLGDGKDGGPISACGAEPVGAYGRERSYLRAHEKCFDDLSVLLAPHLGAALRDAPLERFLDGLTRWNLFEHAYLERLLAGKLPGLRPRHGAKIWLLVTLEAWLRTVVR